MMYDIKYRDLDILEIGVYAGEGTQIFLDSKKTNKIFSVDPWSPKEKFELPEAIFDYFFLNDKRIVKIKGTIDDYIEKFGNPIDLVYIDGGHSYEKTKYHILQSLERIHPKIAISGHDYIKKFEGVILAVNDFLGKPDHVYVDGSWIKYMT